MRARPAILRDRPLRPVCVSCAETMSLAGIEPFTIGEALWEDWIFECDCGKVEKRPKKLDPSAVALPVVTPAE